MDIYVIQPNDTIESIANRFGVNVSSIIQYNELANPYNLATGQTIIIVYPQQTYIVKEGDSLDQIAKNNEITMMQLLRNNPFLSDRNYIYPGESLIIRYNTARDIYINGFTYPFISNNTLTKTLPFLTYISVFNYTITAEGNITTYYDDKDVIEISKNYGTVPLMMTSTLTTQGIADYENTINLLLNEEYQDKIINKELEIIKEKGYYGVNMILNFITSSNISLYNNYVIKTTNRLKAEGYLSFITINPYISNYEKNTLFEKVDFSTMANVVDSISFINFKWGKNASPPGPVSSISDFDQFLEYETKIIPSDKIRIGVPVIGYDWTLPYVAGSTVANAVSSVAAVDLAQETNSIIQFDETSQTPFFQYNEYFLDSSIEHIVWFTDPRSTNAILSLITKYNLSGKGFWNIMVFFAQMWLVINSQFNIIKVIPDNL